MLNEAVSLVKAFHEKAKQNVRETPTLLSNKEVERRVRWITDELQELQEAQSVEDQADAITDALYYLLGCYVEMGINNPDSLFQTIHKSNMKKLEVSSVVYDSDGRVLKPEGWTHPIIQIKK